jgi:hypothetical protein
VEFFLGLPNHPIPFLNFLITETLSRGTVFGGWSVVEKVGILLKE